MRPCSPSYPQHQGPTRMSLSAPSPTWQSSHAREMVSSRSSSSRPCCGGQQGAGVMSKDMSCGGYDGTSLVGCGRDACENGSMSALCACKPKAATPVCRSLLCWSLPLLEGLRVKHLAALTSLSGLLVLRKGGCTGGQRLLLVFVTLRQISFNGGLRQPKQPTDTIQLQ